MGKELQGLEEGPKAKIHLDSLWVRFQKSQFGKRRAMMVYMDTGFKKFTSIYDKLALEMKKHTYLHE